jgi:hypothetical protein
MRLLLATTVLLACVAVTPLGPQARAADGLGVAAGTPATTPESPGGDLGAQPPQGPPGGEPQVTPPPGPPPTPPNDPPDGGLGQDPSVTGGGATDAPPSEDHSASTGSPRSDSGSPASDGQRGSGAPDATGTEPRADAPGSSGAHGTDTTAPTPLPLDDVQVEESLNDLTGGTTLTSASPSCEQGCYAGSIRLSGVLVRAASANRLEQRNRVIREAKASGLSRIAVVRAPDRFNNPFFSLFGGGGGAPGAVLLVGLLAVLAATSLRAPEGMKAFLASTATWRPSAYVPPIESPG